MGELDGESSKVRWNDPPSDDALHAASVKRGDFIRESVVQPTEGRSTYLGYGDIDLSDAEPLDWGEADSEDRGHYYEINKTLQEGEGGHEGVQERYSMRDGTMQKRIIEQYVEDVLRDPGHGDVSPRPSGLRVVREDAPADEAVPTHRLHGALDLASSSADDIVFVDDVPVSEYPDPDTYYDGVEGLED